MGESIWIPNRPTGRTTLPVPSSSRAFHQVALSQCPELHLRDIDTGYGPRVDVVTAKEEPWVPVKDAEGIAREMVARSRVAIYGIDFSPDNQTVEEKNSKVLAEVMKYLKENSGSSVIIESHKMSGDQKEQWDLEITDKRAKAVTTWLVTHGIAPGRLEPKGLGRTKPITQNDTPLEVQQNERIELVQSPPHEGFSQVTR